MKKENFKCTFSGYSSDKEKLEKIREIVGEQPKYTMSPAEQYFIANLGIIKDLEYYNSLGNPPPPLPAPPPRYIDKLFAWISRLH